MSRLRPRFDSRIQISREGFIAPIAKGLSPCAEYPGIALYPMTLQQPVHEVEQAHGENGVVQRGLGPPGGKHGLSVPLCSVMRVSSRVSLRA